MNKFTSIATVFLVLSGCGGGSNEFNTDINPDVFTVTTFDGTWSNGCEYDQSSGIGNVTSLMIDGPDANLDVKAYDNNTCTGTPTNSASASFKINYGAEAALNDCFNGRKISPTMNFPLTINGVSTSETLFDALSADDQAVFGISSAYDLICSNEAVTIIYSGDEATGAGTSEATRPTSADLTFGLNKVL